MIVRMPIRYRWWLKPYLWGVSWVAALMDAEPDMDKVERMIRRGIVVKVEPVRFGVWA